MRTLIVSSSPTPAAVDEEIGAGLHPRIDYLELARHMEADYVDVNRFQAKNAGRWFEDKLRLDFRQAIWVAGLTREKRYDRVLMMSERVAIPIAYLLPASVRQVVVEHNLLLPHRLRMVKMARIHRRWDVLLASSQAEMSAVQKALQPGMKRLEMVLYPVDTKFFRPGSNGRPAAQRDHVLSLGLSKRDFPTLIKAMAGLPHITCHLRVGSTWMAGKGDIEKRHLPGHVVLKPFVTLWELRQCYEDCRFVVIPLQKTTQWSAGSTSVLLAQAMGKPVVVSKTPGMRDYVLDGETGILVETGNPEAMAGAIEHLWNRPDLVDAMGRRAQEWANATFSLEEWVPKMAAILRG